MARDGILGGTFDPIHLGHLDVARAALEALSLARVVLVPAGIPPHRQPPHASADHRFAMAALAVQDHSKLSVSDLDLHGKGPSYTSTLLDRLESSGVDLASIVFVAGADAFRDIPAWKDYPTLLNRCDFAVVSRPSCSVTTLRDTLPSLADRMIDAGLKPTADADVGEFERRSPSIFLIDAPTAAVSSTDVRARAARREPLDGLVPPAVADYIDHHHLYRTPFTGAA